MLPASSPNKFVALSKPIQDASVTTILVGVVVVAALYFGREVLVPIALAVLLSFILSPCVRFLQRAHFPRVVAVIAVGAVAFSAIFGLGTLMVSQVNGLAQDLPRYETTLSAKIGSLRGAAAGTGTLERASEVLHDLSQEINKPKGNSDDLLRERRSTRQTNPCRGQAARSRHPSDSFDSHRTADSSTHNDGHSSHFCGFYFTPASGSEE